MRSFPFIFILFLVGIRSNAQKIKDVDILFKYRSNSFEIPTLNPTDTPVFHEAYSFLYNEQHEQSAWVAYELTKKETEKSTERSNKFLTDPAVITGTATNADYLKSGYDKGHLAPAADMGWSEKVMKESFYFSNMSPQLPSFNRGIWKSLEELVRNWAVQYDDIYIVTGPVLENALPCIGANKVSIPKYYYKVVLDRDSDSFRTIGFILPNKASGDPLQQYAVSIDSVEKITGIDFFPLLEDDIENKTESALCIDCWSWKTADTKNKNDNKKNNDVPITEERKIYTGPKGGKYYFNEAGRKIYLK